MIIEFIIFYLIFLIGLSVILAIYILKHKLPPLKRLSLLMVSLFVLPAILGYLYVAYFSPVSEILVPDLKGKPLASVIYELKSLNLKGRHSGSVYDMEYSDGVVVSQRPEPGRLVKVGRIVTFLTSSGQRKVSVPNLLERPISQAKAVLAARGLKLGEVKEETIKEMGPGIVLVQEPVPEEEVNFGSVINLTISSTMETIKILQEKALQQDSGQGGLRFPWW